MKAVKPFLIRNNPTLTATLVLAFCCIWWGFAFPATQLTIVVAERILGAPAGGWSITHELGVSATLNGWRFLLSALLYGLLTVQRQRGCNTVEVLGGALLGVLVSGGILTQMVGLHYIRPSASSFLTSLTVIFTPLAQAFLLRRAVGVKMWLAVGLAVTGVVILSQPSAGGDGAQAFALIPPLPYLGEGLTILGALFFAAEVLALDHFGPRADAVRLTFWMLASVAVTSLVVGTLTSGGELYATQVFMPIWQDHTFQWAMGGTIVLSGALAFHLMNVYQPFVSPARASVIYCLEPVFATGFSVVFGNEVLTVMTVAGAAVILVAVLITNLNHARSANAQSATLKSDSVLK